MIRLEKLSKSFGRTKALDGLTLTAEAGEKIALVGANGAGKTTLFRCLLGEYEYDGVVRVDDRDPRRDRTSVLKNVGFVPRIRSQAAHRHIFEHASPQRADGAFDRRNGHRKFLS